MMEKEETTNQLDKSIGHQRYRRIRDYDDGLLQNNFEDITGTPYEVFNKWCDKLNRTTTRIMNLDETAPILKAVSYTHLTLPTILLV